MANIPRKLRALTVGQTVLFGGAVVAASLGSFYLNIHRIHNKKVEDGSLPHYEHLLAHVGSGQPGAAELPITRFEQRTTLLSAPKKEHRSGHSTIADFKLSAVGRGEPRAGLEQPTPQRPKEVGSKVAYTKSPDYVKSYEKHVEVKIKGASKAVAEVEEVAITA